MRIGCLQFAPQVGDVDNNLNRADSVLAKANQDDLDSLDVLILPELAFTGMWFPHRCLPHGLVWLGPCRKDAATLTTARFFDAVRTQR